MLARKYRIFHSRVLLTAAQVRAIVGMHYCRRGPLSVSRITAAVAQRHPVWVRLMEQAWEQRRMGTYARIPTYSLSAAEAAAVVDVQNAVGADWLSAMPDIAAEMAWRMLYSGALWVHGTTLAARRWGVVGSVRR